MLSYITAEEAIARVKSHDHIHISSAAQVPNILIEALADYATLNSLTDIKFHHAYSDGRALFASEQYKGIFCDQTFFIGPGVRKSVKNGVADYIPIHLSDTQKVYREHIVPCDVAIVMVSEPDTHGYVSLGGDVVCTLGALDVAKTKIAVVNPNVPFTQGDSVVPISRFDCFVYDETPLVYMPTFEPTEVEVAIGKNCANLIEDGACLQIGVGGLTNALAIQLKDHKHLGLHTETFADGVLELIKTGVIDGSMKKIDTGKAVSSFLLGSKDVFDFVNQNPSILIKDVAYTNNPHIIAQNPKVASVNSAIQIDLSGQVCADSVGTRMISGIGGQTDFIRGAALSEGGISIIAIASRTKTGQSKIVPVLEPGSGVTCLRSDVQWVVTEYGAVNLQGKTLKERAKLLISIAHPEDKELLERNFHDIRK